ncbi:PhzF family phenazine biosynthesis protein [Pseudoalteromonas sp. MMG013]|uniref:PhzF family phenazine biosynthesis protein n=1 Tax=Pseudoalteromonas sp. MMG013 TaxID=2822687 RepID=UPI001B3735FA|nr:PhzF family phenazine biosynthesis protein [Pseudoalteromonas sp. MMG013]MBQ4864311.1 PhzF family phenazine biosynthesis protein [Pseudoalteromonas sp. MMG013]
MNRKLEICYIDAFASRPFTGNTAAVVKTQDWLSDSLMQSIASQNNLSETAFMVLRDDNYHIRWFSPKTEIGFCGHATLASAHYLFEENSKLTNVTFNAKAVGSMVVRKLADGMIEMNFPNQAPSHLDTPPQALLAGLSIVPDEIGCNEQAYFAIYNDEADVIAVQQIESELLKLAPKDVVVSAPSKQYDFISRYFWPSNGGSEDAVTGSIHTGLAPYWAKKLNNNSLHAYQASGRGGELLCTVKDHRVLISGKAVTYLKGHIWV